MIFSNKKIILAISLIATFYSNSQTTICLGDDVTVCAGSPVQIDQCGGGGGVGNSNGLILDNPTIIQPNLGDDVWSGVINIGFSFSFYGNTYNQLIIGSNGLMSFNVGQANGGCAYGLTTVGPLPNAGFATARNTIMNVYQDIHPSIAGTTGDFQYQTIGSVPNRKFVFLIREIGAFNCGIDQCNYMATVLNEGSNTIELYIGRKETCVGWNGGLAIQGIQNNAGTIAHIVPGRNNTQWSVLTPLGDGQLFTPTSPTNTSNYVITQVPYVQITGDNNNFLWNNTLGQTFPYNNGVLNIPNVQNGTVGYYLSASSCGAALGAVSDTSWVTGVSSSVSISSTPDICSSGIGTVTATPTSGMSPYTFNWPTLGSQDQTVTNVFGGNYIVQMTDGMGCTSMANVFVGDTPADYTSSSTLVSCFEGNDGTATVTMVPELGNISYQWDDPAAQTTQTAVGLSAGTYTCNVTSDIGCNGFVSVTVSEIPQMVANFTTITNTTCNSAGDGILTVFVTDGTSPYSYSWDNSTSTSATADDLFAGDHIVTVTDANGCIITHQGTIGEPDPLNISNLTPDTQICAEDDILLTVEGTGGSTPMTFSWYENGDFIGNGTSITVDPDDSGTNYTVVLSEECNSPRDSATLIITFPTPIIPVIEPNRFEDCVVGEFDFYNNSINRDEIATTYFNFGDQNSTIEIGYDSTSHEYTRVGNQTIDVTITSIYGCIYEKTFEDIVSVKPLPNADFNFSQNPASSFENSVTLFENSSVDVVDWQWFAPDLFPSSSTEENPTFTYPLDVEAEYPISLVVTSYLGCTDTVTLLLSVQDELLFFAPNSFTPDGDELNHTWNISVRGISITDFNLKIFNGWGEVIWETYDPSEGWDGTYNGRMVQTGTYVWKASMKKINTDEKVEFNGYINMLK